MNKDAMQNLLKSYPDNRFLIKRIFDPVEDIDAAIAAPNLTLLYLDDSSLNEYEKESMIFLLTRFLKAFEYRWYIHTHEFEDLYPLAFWSLLWYTLPLVLLTKRILNIRTADVHPYYVWEYLTSVGFDNYQGYFSRNQEMFLYKNTEYIKFNVGKKFLLEILEDVFLSSIRYSLKEPMIVSHTTNRSDYGDKIQDVVYKKDNLIDFTRPKLMQTFLLDLNESNLDPNKTQIHRNEIENKLRLSNTNILRTKYLDIVKNQNFDSLMIVVKFILDTFVLLQKKEKLAFTIDIKSNLSERILEDISPTDIINIFYYCIYKLDFQDPINLPEMYRTTSAIVETSKPIFSNDSFFVNEEKFNVNDYVNIEDFLDDVPYCSNMLSSNLEFSDKAGEQFDYVFNIRRDLRNTAELRRHTSLLRLATTIIPEDYGITLPQTFTTYAELFANNPDIELFLEEYDSVDVSNFYTLIYTLIESICPLFQGFKELAEDNRNSSVVVSKMKELFSYLTSYNVTMLPSDNDNIDVYPLPQLNCMITMKQSTAIMISGNSDSCNALDQYVSIPSESNVVIDEVVNLAGIVTNSNSDGLINFTPEVISPKVNTISNRMIYFSNEGNTIEVTISEQPS